MILKIFRTHNIFHFVYGVIGNVKTWIRGSTKWRHISWLHFSCAQYSKVSQNEMKISEMNKSSVQIHLPYTLHRVRIRQNSAFIFAQLFPFSFSILSASYWHVFAKILLENFRNVLDGCIEWCNSVLYSYNEIILGALYDSIQCVDDMQLFLNSIRFIPTQKNAKKWK